MKSASRVLYMIGFVFNIIGVVGYIISLLVFALTYSSLATILPQLGTEMSLAMLQYIWMTIIIICAVVLAFNIATLVIVCFARKALKEGTGSYVQHILILIFSVLSANLIYLVASILGLAAASDDLNAQE